MLVAVSAGELSGRLLAASLGRGFVEAGYHVELLDLMESGRLEPVLGFWEGIRAGPQARRALWQAVIAVRHRRPDVVLLVAFPGVNLRLGTAARRAGIPVVYLAPPQVWAWGASRAGALRQAADRVVCLFPFEQSVLTRAGIRARFLGYPLLDEILAESAGRQSPIGDYVALMPGSRPAETTFHRPLFADAMRELAETRDEVEALWIAAPERHAGEDLLAAARGRYRLMAGARAAAVVSGTATLETALLGVPQVVSYHLGMATRLVARLLVKTPFFTLPNILAGGRVVPEYLEPDSGRIAAELRRQLSPGSRVRARDLAERLAELLGPVGARRRIARLVVETARTGVTV